MSADIDITTPPNDRNAGESYRWWHHMQEGSRSFMHPVRQDSPPTFSPVWNPYTPEEHCQTTFAAYAVAGHPGRACYATNCVHGYVGWWGDPAVMALVLSPQSTQGRPDNDDRDSLDAAFDILRAPEDCP
jgi:hypothetical protein